MATHMPMSAARQPFAPLNSSRLQNLTSLKNRQNAISSPIKRKAASFDDDAENVDPIIWTSPKRSKAQDGSSQDPSSYVKPVNFFLTKAPPSPNDFASLKSTPASPIRRPILSTRSPAPKVNTVYTKSTPLSAPAGRSPTRKRIGILSRRKTHARVDPPKFSTPSGSGLGFSIDAALSGTISSRARPTPASAPSLPMKENAHLIPTLHTPEPKPSWSFEIYEDTPEELATNLMEHSTCTLDISSDEESATRLLDERGKENVPPLDDISQTRVPLTSSASSLDGASEQMSDLKSRIRARHSQRKIAAGEIDIDRSPLGDLAAEDFYAEGCCSSSVFIIAPDETASDSDSAPVDENSAPAIPVADLPFDFNSDIKGKGREIPEHEAMPSNLTVDALMAKNDYELAPKAPLLEPIEKAEEGFEIWASSSAKDEGEDEL
ncbi:hypothetical protein HYALB_00004881 [Hymenoscyphus albidus]|uniref:Thymidylate kinase n=1 Tax=Hymenoscyphus albidus TaxID=595503 RepID=A0A9N9M0Y9_9HELO|nr:hypothetical protein HYALB_00004881 [Hymenoscyphus albidus]